MIYGAIVEQGEKYYTELGKLFRAISNEQLNYNWLITDCVCCTNNSEINDLLSKEYCWMTGKQLTEIVEKESFQWIWGVLSGFDKDISLSDILKYPLPYANGYENFWKNSLTMQNPLSRIEIVPWDGSLTLIFSDNQSTIVNFMKEYLLSKNLMIYNKSSYK